MTMNHLSSSLDIFTTPQRLHTMADLFCSYNASAFQKGGAMNMARLSARVMVKTPFPNYFRIQGRYLFV